MEQQEKKHKRVEDLDESGVASLLQRWELDEFVEFTKAKQIDGRRLLNVTEGIVKLWRPKANAKNFITFIEDLKLNPHKYLDLNITKYKKQSDTENNKIDTFVETIIEQEEKEENIDIESQYQTIPIRKKEEQTSAMSTVEELIRRIVPAKSFLYRHKQRVERTPSYLPMDSGTQKKRKLFTLSSYEYPFFDLKSRFSRQQSANDRGYYAMQRNSKYITRPNKKPETKNKYKSLPTPEALTEKYAEDHFYEDLCYNEVERPKDNPTESRIVIAKPCIVKIQELFQSFKVPFFKRQELVEDKKVEVMENEKETNLYENSDSIANMYDSVHVIRPVGEVKSEDKAKAPVEDYLEPVQLSKDYCDISYKQKDESLLGYILSIFENRFGFKRETTDDHNSSDSESEHKVESTPIEDGCKWPEEHKHGRTNMADRPLPVPVENEPYYMNIDRGEAQNLLKGQPDGTFVLRPSSQTDHAYTISVACSNTVHNVGVRRRPDGRLALGFPRRGEQSFGTVTSLLRHHKKRRLLLVAGGDVIGATTLNESPHYYQCPSSIPVPVLKE